eukprot:CAMPEP_0195507384 /NCGR_PEP_ID=MMETSP0794_2-20130614/845_1 /TAXON_ID=515487 /ORGANISM="Stephanopyxis turris, Strain CCMP 815" /LENGTH=318 /DNA_ID=CAMNT_0040634045 /DNA_START=322 /DNA_END=1278 /DNA_ORIENTATION=+
MSYVADSSDYQGESDYDSSSEVDDLDAPGGPGFRELQDADVIEEEPVPMSKNSGNRFVAIVYDKLVDRNGMDRMELHENRVKLNTDHILWARKANLYNETFNMQSAADVVWSYPLLSTDKQLQIGHAICIDSNTVAQAQELLSREPIIQSLTGGDIGSIPFYRWRHIKDHSLRQDDGRFGTPYIMINEDRTDELVAGLREELSTDHIAYLIKSKKTIMAGPLHKLTESKSDPASTAVGSIVIANAKDRAAAVSFAENDPFAKAGLYNSMRVHVFNHLDVSGKFVTPNIYDEGEADEVKEAMQVWGYPVEDRQTKWING